MKKYKVGDIVFVAGYKYKSGMQGRRHCFVIIDEEQAVDIDYFGFLISSHIEKEKYPYNERINKDDYNKLYKNSIVKCDDLIKIKENQIQFKIGQVVERDLKRFINTYEKFLEEN